VTARLLVNGMQNGGGEPTKQVGTSAKTKLTGRLLEDPARLLVI